MPTTGEANSLVGPSGSVRLSIAAPLILAILDALAFVIIGLRIERASTNALSPAARTRLA